MFASFFDPFNALSKILLLTAYATLPRTVSAAASVPYGNTFLLAGGEDSIYKFLPETEEWEEMPEKLSEGKFGVTAMLIHPEDIDANDNGVADYVLGF